MSLSVATLVTWALNRQFTFGDLGAAPASELGRYALVALLAQSVNFLVFLALCAVWPGVIHSLAAVVGAVIATGFLLHRAAFLHVRAAYSRPPVE